MQQAASIEKSSPRSQRRGLQQQGLRGQVFCPAVGQHRLHQLELGDRLAELASPKRVAHHLVDQTTRQPDGRGADVKATAVDRAHREFETVALVAQQRIGRHHAVVEVQVTGVDALLAHFQVRLALDQSRRATLAEEHRHTLASAGPGIGARQNVDDIRLRRAGDKALGAVDHPAAVAAPGRGCRQVGRVGAACRLRQRERCEQLTGRNTR